uniref:Si:ch73-303b9.1 n=1 Tax=Paramormyrops kingsleyae TaxID=1676925 RepID=A0A3B3T442_9TELE
LSKSNEASSSTDLNRGFLVDKSLSVSASLLDLPPEGQRWHISCSGIVVEYTEASPSSFASWTHSPTLLSPSVFPESHIGPSETPKLSNAIPVGSKSSTPCEGENVKKMILGGPVEHASVDQAASQFSWEISLIKSGPISSPCNPESSLL